MMTVSRLLKSWAMPPVSWPIGLHLLRLAQRLLGGGAARGLPVKSLGAHERQPRERDEEGGRRHAEEQMAAQKSRATPVGSASTLMPELT